MLELFYIFSVLGRVYLLCPLNPRMLAFILFTHQYYISMKALRVAFKSLCMVVLKCTSYCEGSSSGNSWPWTPITQHKSVSHFNYIHAFPSPFYCCCNQISCTDLMSLSQPFGQCWWWDEGLTWFFRFFFHVSIWTYDIWLRAVFRHKILQVFLAGHGSSVTDSVLCLLLGPSMWIWVSVLAVVDLVGIPSH